MSSEGLVVIARFLGAMNITRLGIGASLQCGVSRSSRCYRDLFLAEFCAYYGA